MITGVRLTQLANGEPLLGSQWYYNNLSGIDAVQKRLSDLFGLAQEVGFTFIVDTIKPSLTQNGDLTLINNGIYGNLWSFTERINLYETLLLKHKLNMFMEIEFPTVITDDNWKKYADYFITLIEQYPWIEYWQIMVTPELKDNNNNYRCSPIHYVRFLKYIYPIIKVNFSSIKIGGPGIFDALIDYINRDNTTTDWLSIAIGDTYNIGSPEYLDIGPNGFLPFIDFFSIQAKQNINSNLSYENFPQIADRLINDLKLKVNKEFVIFSTYQGHTAYMDNSTALNTQGYYDLREMLNCIKKGIIPFKAQLVDEYFNINTQLDNNKYHMGIIQYYIEGDAKKQSFFEYKFLLNNLREFNKIVNVNSVVDNYNNIDILTLINDNEDKTATIIWPKTTDETTVTLQPHYARQYIASNGEKNAIVNPTQILFNIASSDGIKFIIIFQTINRNIINIEELEASVNKKLNYTEEILSHFISLLPNSYNKEITDVNYYKILRAIALEMADAKIVVDKLSDNLYLNTASDEAIYNNFGVLINLNKKADWSNDKYKRLIKGVTKSLLDGPTHESIINAIKLFTNFNVNIYELYKNYTHIDINIVGNTKPQYAFVVEIERPIDASAELDFLLEDANYVINIVKPAHTIQFVIIMLSGEENYKTHYKNKYGKDLSQGINELYQYNINTNVNNEEGIYGWKSLNYDGQFKTANLAIENEVFTNNSLTNGALLIGPRYVLYDECDKLIEYNIYDKYNYLYDILGYVMEMPQQENYSTVYDGLNTTINQSLIEPQFGFNHDMCFQLTSSMLNLFRLAPTTNLNDELLASLEVFLQEKYSIQSSTISTALSTFYQDKIKKIEETFDNDIINNYRENIGNFLESTQYLIDQLKSEYYNAVDKVQEQDSNEVLINEHYERNTLEAPLEFEPGYIDEYYRAWELSDSWYHIHKTYNAVNSNNKFFKFPNNDLAELYDAEEDKSIEVYVNGMLQPTFSYKEMKLFNVPDKITGIIFEPDTIINGDIVSILYSSVQQLIIGNFPIVESKTVSIEFNNLDAWKIIEKINESLHVYIHYDSDNLDESNINILDKIKDDNNYFYNDNNYSNYYNYYHSKEDKNNNIYLDVPEFEGSPYLDTTEFNISHLPTLATLLNFSMLNLTMLGTIENNNNITPSNINAMYSLNERSDIQMAHISEEFNSPNFQYTMEEYQIINDEKIIIRTL